MLNILLATARPDTLRPFAEALASDPEVHLEQVASAADALSTARASSPHLAIVDFALPDADPLVLVRELLLIDAMISTAVVSPLSEQQFHEAGEGLGILARLPVMPGRSDAEELLRRLRNILPVP